MFFEDLVDSKWGRIVQGFRSRSGFETKMSFASPSRRKATQVAVWIEDCVSWKFGKLTNIDIAFSWCLIAGFRETRLGF